MYNELIILLKVIVAAFCGYIFSEQLTKPGMILNSLYLWLEGIFDYANPRLIKVGKDRWIYIPYEWIFKPLIGCFRCVCGQWALWTYFVQSIICHATDFNFFHLCAYALIGVGVGIISHKILNDE